MKVKKEGKLDYTIVEFWASSPTPSVRAQFPFREFKRKEKEKAKKKARMDGPVAASLTLLGLALGNATLLKRKKRFGMDIQIQESPLDALFHHSILTERIQFSSDLMISPWIDYSESNGYLRQYSWHLAFVLRTAPSLLRYSDVKAITLLSEDLGLGLELDFECFLTSEGAGGTSTEHLSLRSLPRYRSQGEIDPDSINYINRKQKKDELLEYMKQDIDLLGLPTLNEDAFLRRGYYGGNIDVYKPKGVWASYVSLACGSRLLAVNQPIFHPETLGPQAILDYAMLTFYVERSYRSVGKL
ncbi:hypothetical protein KSP39_PZI014070 [Platanthera zijinensis]|uniref:Uncharacterized protein n=1 Tax=Platanthera zijinensis TaxID=2320716 RepID=A0AAP0BC50_9ASPA